MLIYQEAPTMETAMSTQQSEGPIDRAPYLVPPLYLSDVAAKAHDVPPVFSDLKAFTEYLDQLPPDTSRSQEEIDRQVVEERASWD